MVLELTSEGNANDQARRGRSEALADLLETLKLDWIFGVVLSWSNDPSLKPFIK